MAMGYQEVGRDTGTKYIEMSLSSILRHVQKGSSWIRSVLVMVLVMVLVTMAKRGLALEAAKVAGDAAVRVVELLAKA